VTAATAVHVDVRRRIHHHVGHRFHHGGTHVRQKDDFTEIRLAHPDQYCQQRDASREYNDQTPTRVRSRQISHARAMVATDPTRPARLIYLLLLGQNMADQDSTAAALFKALTKPDPTRPVITFYDHGTGERTELSGVTMDNWVAKTANLLVDGCGLGRGDVAALWLPPHWQTAVVLLGCWSAGLAVEVEPVGEVDAAVAFAAAAIVEGAIEDAATPLAPYTPERYALGLAPMGLPLAAAPAGWVDYIVEVRGHGDRYSGPLPANPDPAWVESGQRMDSHMAFCERALHRARELAIPPGGRVLFDVTAYPDPVDWLMAPLTVGATTVLTRGACDIRALAAAENASAVP
jgi:uncharacterized protein (TIGR03089 family)